MPVIRWDESMETLDAIRTRRSVRSFTDRPVPEELIQQLVSSAMSAPSAGNQQPWHFVVIDDRHILDAVPGIHPYAAMARSAPLGILVCGDTTLEKFKGFWVQDCSASTQNLLLAAHDQGLGAVWTGIFPLEERIRAFRTLCGLPEHVIPLALVVVGFPDRQPGPEDRFRQDRVHRNRW